MRAIFRGLVRSSGSPGDVTATTASSFSDAHHF